MIAPGLLIAVAAPAVLVLVLAGRAALGRRARDAGAPEPEAASAPLLRATADAFGRALIVVNDGGPALLAGEEALGACARILGVAAGSPADRLAAILAASPAAAAALAGLGRDGTAFDLELAGPLGRLVVSGRTAGALALASLALAPEVRRPGRAEPDRRAAAAQDLILEQVADAVAIFGPDQRLAWHNGAFARLWSLEPAWLAEAPTHGALLERLRRDRRLPEVIDFARFKAQELARHEQLEPAADAVWRVAGERTLRVLSLPHPDGGLVRIFSDITPEVRLKSQWNQLIQVRQATLDKLTDAVAVFGADARLKLHNEAFQALWSIPPEALAGEAAYDDIVAYCLARLHDTHFWSELKGRITDPDPGVRAAARGEALAADGALVAWQSRPLPDGATLVSFTDVTDARRVETALSEREAALETAEQLKRDFVASVSYELRTPLTTILGYAELLDAARDDLSPRTGAWVTAVRAAASDLARTVEDILAFAELDAGEMTLDFEPVAVAPLIEGAIARLAGRAAQAGVSLVADNGDSGAVLADRARLDRVLDHLVENALGNTAPGGRIRLSARRALGEVCLQVADDGRGIPFHVQAHIFDRFSGDEGAGGGIGLALVKALVELHGGWVAVESQPGQGAVFTCHLPETGQAGAA